VPTDTRHWVRAAGWLAGSAVLGVAARGIGELSLRTRAEPLTAVLREQNLDLPELIRGAWSQRQAAGEFGLVVAAVAILVVVAVSAGRRARLVPPVATGVVVAWALAGWYPGCDVPWPGPTPPVHAWGARAPTAWDVALLGPLTLIGVIWLVAALARRWGLGRPSPGPPRASRTALAVVSPICAAWALGGAVAAALLLSRSAVCSMVVPPWWLLLLAVPVAALASGTGGIPLLLSLACTVALGLDHLRHAAFTLDARPLVAVALVVGAVLGASAWRPLAAGLDELLT
jgi:hypothetical protein